MQSLQAMASSFRPPAFTDEQLAEMARRSEEWERSEKLRLIESRLARAGIPMRYRDAKLDDCDKLARFWLEELDTPGIILRGKVGRGKTHTACAMLNEAVKNHGVMFSSFGEILRECKATFSGQGTERDVIDRYTGVPLLAIDDFGKERMTEWALPTVFTVIESRHSSGRRTIYTTQYESLAQRLVVDGNADTAKAIASRLAEYTVLEFTGPDRRLA